jgi:long-chain acyl-CoA synthetase
MDTVGPPLRGVEVRIAEDGEILVRGELVMHGYWRNEAETAKALQDGWLHTGDIGHLDKDGPDRHHRPQEGHDRQRQGRQCRAPAVEGMLTLQPEIAQAMVIGDKRPYIVGLIVPDAEWALEWARANGEKFDMAACRTCPPSSSGARSDRPGQPMPTSR